MSDSSSELQVRAQARVGTVLRGKYRIDRVLGIGGMAVVYKATHRNQAEFAVKMLHAELSIREDVRMRFRREGYAANSVKHPGAVLVVDDDVAEDGSAFLVMELLDGGGVEALWESARRRMPATAAVAVAYQLLDVLAAAHAKGIVHRDIKPANLFVARDGTVKVLDFGIARARDAAASDAQATGTGMLLGTPAFMPPEQALAKSSEIDGLTDVWAVGATVFTLVSGYYVHEGENAPQLMIKAATTHARSLASAAPDVPRPIVEVVDRALAFQKQQRWPSAVAMRDALGEAYEASFGERISRAPLAALWDAHDVGLASTYNPPAPQRVGPVATLTAMFSGGTTAQPVASEGPASGFARALKARKTRTVRVAAGVIVLVMGTMGVMMLTKGRENSPGAGNASSSTSSAATPPAATVPAPSVTASATLAVAASSMATPMASSPPTAPMPMTHVQPRQTPPAKSAAVSPPHAPTPSCDPPTWTDSQGHVHIKPGCS